MIRKIKDIIMPKKKKAVAEDESAPKQEAAPAPPLVKKGAKLS